MRKPYPGYEKHVEMVLGAPDGTRTSMTDLQKTILSYRLAEGTTMEDRMIPGREEGQQIRIRIVKPAGLPAKAPVILDIHGGGFVSGTLDIDNYRCIYLAEHTPCLVVSVEYRLARPDLPAPAQLNDCYAAFLWLSRHAAEIGGDPGKLGIHGTSAGGNLAAALALYLRDTDGPVSRLTVLNCPALQKEMTISKYQFGDLGTPAEKYSEAVENIYAGLNGQDPSYYIMPAYCRDLRGLGNMSVVVAEYDPLRDEGLDFARRLLEAGVPCELVVAPRVTHGFCVIDQPLTRYVHNGICASFRREFGMEIRDF